MAAGTRDRAKRRRARERRQAAEVERVQAKASRDAEAEAARLEQRRRDWEATQELERRRQAERAASPDGMTAEERRIARRRATVPPGLSVEQAAAARAYVAKVELQAHRSRWRFGWRARVRSWAPWRWRPLWANLGPYPPHGRHEGNLYRSGYFLGPLELRRWSAVAMAALRERRKNRA